MADGLFGGDWGVSDFLGFLGFQGDPEAKKAGDVYTDIINAIANYSPALFQTIRDQILPNAEAELAAAQTISPKQAQLNYDITSKYAPMLADVENRISQERKLADTSGDLAVARGPGRELAAEATDIGSSIIDPEFFASRKAIGDKTVELVNSLDPNGLSGGERAEVERAVNAENAASGNTGNTGGINTVGNAMHFGSALNAKRASIGNTLSGAASNLQNMRSGIDYFGRAQTNTPYTNSFQAVQKPNDSAQQFGSQIFSGVTGLAQQEQDINANRRDSLDRVTGILGSI